MRTLPLTLARCSALGLMAVTPWLYGGTLPWTISLVSQCLLVVTALAGVGWLVAWHKPQIGWVFPVSLGLLALGWTSTLYPRSRFDDMLMLLFPLEGVPTLGSWFQGTVDQDRSQQAMLRLSGLLGLLWVARDMAVEARWRRAIVWTIAITGTSVAMHGLIQKTVGDVWGYWQVEKLSPYAFAGFWYHANAAAFLNLIWPFIATLILDNFVRKGNQVIRALLLVALFTLVTSILINVSKAGHILFGLQAILFSLLALPSFLRSMTGKDDIKKMLTLTVSVIVLIGGGLAVFFGTGQSEKRWEKMSAERLLGGDSRFESARFCLGALPQAGWQGYGPGTFEAVFLDTGTTHPDKVPKNRWRFAHQDTLQTLLEWGWLGGAGWIALGVGMLVQSYWRLVKLRQPYFSNRLSVKVAAVAALTGVAAHAQMDFPLQILAIQIMVTVIIGMGSQTQRHEKPVKKRSSRKVNV